MIVAISRFVVRNGMEEEVRRAFEDRPRRVESEPAFLGLEVLQQGPEFVLLTRWTDEASFRQWHRSPKHKEAHELIPAGLKLDPKGTQLIVGERIDAATTGGDAGRALLDYAAPLAKVLERGESVHYAVIDEAGRVVEANAAFAKLIEEEVVGFQWHRALNPASLKVLLEHLDDEESESVIVQVTPGSGEPQSLRIVARRLPAGYVLVGEPPWQQQRELAEQTLRLNAELAVLSRENARQARRLDEAHKKLRDTYWHLEKISEVLPICASCHAVRNNEGDWEELATFVHQHADFLSHAYCEKCAKKFLHEDDEELL